MARCYTQLPGGQDQSYSFKVPRWSQEELKNVISKLKNYIDEILYSNQVWEIISGEIFQITFLENILFHNSRIIFYSTFTL